MNILLHDTVIRMIERLSTEERGRAFASLHFFQRHADFDELFTSSEFDVVRLNTDSVSQPLAYREMTTPLYSATVGATTFTFTLTTSADDEPSILILEISVRIRRWLGRENADDRPDTSGD